MRVTLSMIVKNESKYLRGCLDSVFGAVDEIVIVDTGSNDDTIAIAEEYGAKVFHFPWQNDFSMARNFALEKSTGDWILYLDADERLTPGSIQELRKITSADERCGYEVTLRSVDDLGGRPNIMRYVRLFRYLPGVYFRGRVHEQILDSLFALGYSVKPSNIELLHLGYNVNEDELKAKARRNLELLLQEYTLVPSGYTAFHLGQSYSFLRDMRNAEKYFSLAVQDPELRRDYRAHSYRFLSALALEAKNISVALEFSKLALEADSNLTLVNLVAGKVLYAAGDPEQGAVLCKKAFTINKEIVVKGKSSDFDVLVDPETLCYHLLELGVEHRSQELFDFAFSELRELRGNDDGMIAEMYLIRKLMNSEPLDREAIDAVTMISEKNLGAYMKLLSEYNNEDHQLLVLESLIEKFSANPDYLRGAGTIYLNREYHEKAITCFDRFLQTGDADPSVMIFLISALLKSGETDRALTIALQGKELFESTANLKDVFYRIEKSLRQING